MKLIISEIPEEGLDLNLDNLTIISEAVMITSPLKGELRVDKVGKEIFVKGYTSTEIELTCSRCLNNFKKEVSLDISLTYHPLSELKGDEVYELHDDEMEVDFYSGDEIDIDSLIEEEILLNIPMKPLCSEDCKGLCPGCGTDLNTGSCVCPGEAIDERFAILKKLLKKGE
ncbi:MAG: DUF177 domain-containing protein [Thermodesulfovibrionales bacterium]|nr:DUF177 domain-containing protein [Thermodesulfovibrionales bacterium]